MIWILIAYFTAIWLVTRRMDASNEAFFRGGRQSSWLMVAYGMVGASLSGVSFVSVPGMVGATDMTYLQTCMGFILGYVIVAFVLLPLYYRLNLTSIYSLLQQRLGDGAHNVGAWFFIISDMAGSAVKFFLVCAILQQFVFSDLGIPFAATVPLLIGCIWLYTRRGGIRALVLTDVLQTTCMLVTLCLIIWAVASEPGVSLENMSHTRVFEFGDWSSKQHFAKQFISGAFIVVVMTGLNQNMMQKNLTCRTLKDAQKDMCLSGVLFVPVNALFLILGALLLQLNLPATGDGVLPAFVQHVSHTPMGAVVMALFVLGIVSATFSTADSSLTALTTSFCVDIAKQPDNARLRRITHMAMAAVLVALVYLLRCTGSQSLIDLVYTLVSYTYGPLLGLFALAVTTRKTERALPSLVVAAVCVASPILCYVLAQFVPMGYELLLLNGAITFAGLKLAKLIFLGCGSGKSGNFV